MSRIKILTRLKETDTKMKEIYDRSYDLRVQADYGKEAKVLPLNKENLEKVLNKIKEIVGEVKERLGEEKEFNAEQTSS